MIIKLLRKNSEYYVDIKDSMIKVSGLRPIDYLLIALVYGLGIRYIDKYGGDECVIDCEIVNEELRCKTYCSGHEDGCFVYKLLVHGGFSLRCLSQS
ncbi:hypothetical protein [Vulcanisaeta sp. JCM 16159]|uniref:hypothetical protein n=1 Tax=Vulcanisaeta sp. JCM 16159 TaxID=1295371 RepID=UPI0006D2760F|nr:hypothetical protein [Vulcanisaeta sp. JCM 16159]